VKPDGAVAHWNKTNPPTSFVHAGDRIVAVNHVEGDSRLMITEGTKCFKEKLRITLNVESSRQPNLIVTPGMKQQVQENLIVIPGFRDLVQPGQSAPVRQPGHQRPAGGLKRPAPEGGDQIDAFIAQWGLTPDAAGFIRQQKPQVQDEILKNFSADGHKDPIGIFFSFARRIINAVQTRQPMPQMPRLH